MGDRIARRYQEKVKDLAEAKEIEHQDLFSLVAALGHAKVPVKPELSEALMERGPGAAGFDAARPGARIRRCAR